MKHLLSGRVIERTFKSGDKLDLADVVKQKCAYSIKRPDGAIFMDEKSFEQIKIPFENIDDTLQMASR